MRNLDLVHAHVQFLVQEVPRHGISAVDQCRELRTEAHSSTRNTEELERTLICRRVMQLKKFKCVAETSQYGG